ncbi:MAG TPA: glycosyl hydrolase, partial [Actinomycetota bacterium]|nr:glycosyl hydrolase [Actinomycetota bacterium]
DAPLHDAARTARASLEHFDGERTWRHPPVFNAVWFRNLLALDAISAVPGLHDALDHYLDRVWRTARDPATGLFTGGGIGSYDGTPAIDQAGLVQLFALRAWPHDRLQDVC